MTEPVHARARSLAAINRLAGRTGRSASYGLLVLDLVALAWVIISSFLPRGPVIAAVDILFGVVMAAEFAMRLRKARHPVWEVLHPAGAADMVAIASFLLPWVLEAWGFLRVLRTLRLLRSARLIAQLRHDLPLVRRNEEVVVAVADFVVFLVVMTGLVHGFQHDRNPDIGNWADALYFTVTALTTTGFGDITLQGTSGRLLSVIIMLAGVTLFLRLAQALFRPVKVRFRCPTCGLGRHEPDAVHCKACGTLLNMPDDED